MTTNDELERYEASEARDVVALLKKLGPRHIERAPASFQGEVLRRLKAKKAARRRITWTAWYQVPLSVTAGLILGVVLAPFLLSPEQTQRNNDPLEFRGKAGELHPVAKHVPEEWLESIAELLVKGQVVKAYSELGEFRSRYPDYERNAAQ